MSFKNKLISVKAWVLQTFISTPAEVYLFKVNKGNT